MKTGIVFLFYIFSATFLFAEISPEANDCNCQTNTPESKILNAEDIFSQFEQGIEKVKVIVNLQTPQMLAEKKVDWDSEESLNELHEEVNQMQTEVIETFEPNELEVAHLFENQAGFSCKVTEERLYELTDDPLVQSIEPDYVLEEHLAQGIPLLNGLVYRSTYNGQGVAVAICDSGVDYTHPKLGGGGFPNSKVIGGYDFGDNDSNPFPTAPFDPHGTSCAGIVAGDLGDVNDYIGGVAHNAKLYALKTKNSSGTITTSALASSWDWCTSHKNDDPCNPILVISTSIGGTRYYSPCDGSNTTLANAANNATAAGITVVVSSGNNGYCDSMAVPACLTNTISAGAVYDANFGPWNACIYSGSCVNPKYTSTFCSGGYYATDLTYADRVTSFSNIAYFLDVLAPANNNYTTDMVGAQGYSPTDYADDFGGTSAAAPYTAGSVACLQSAAKAITGQFLTPARVRQILTSTGDSVTDVKVAITKPRVNLGNAIDYVLSNPCTDITIGTGSLSWTYPFFTYYHDARTEVIYQASEIGPRGFIQSIALYVTTIPGQVMNNWKIRMKHTTMNTFSSCALDASGWTVVFQSNEPRGNTGWRMFTFPESFYYNGSDNLLVDFSFNNSSYTTNGQVRYSTPGGNRSVYAYSDSGFGDPLNWNGSTSPTVSCSINVPNAWFVVCPVTPGDLQPDGGVDISDLLIMANQWLDVPGVPSADIAPEPNGDNIINFRDFAELSFHWLE